MTPGCCDGAEAERAPARGTSPITTPPAPAHRLLAQRRRVRRVMWVTRDPSPNRASRIGRGKRAGPRRGARDTDAYDDQERADESLKHRAARRCPSLPRRLEPQPRGGVTRRAVAQRRSRAGGLTRPWAEVIRGFGLEFCCRFGSPIPLRYGVSFLFSVFYL